MKFMTEIMADAVVILCEKSQDLRIQTAGGDLFDRAVLVHNTQNIVSAYTDRFMHRNAADDVEQRFTAAFERYRNEFNVDEQKSGEDSIRESFIRRYSEPIADYLLTQFGRDSAHISALMWLISEKLDETVELNNLASSSGFVGTVGVIFFILLGVIWFARSNNTYISNITAGYLALGLFILFIAAMGFDAFRFSLSPSSATPKILENLDKDELVKTVRNAILDDIEVRFPRANTEDFSNSTSFSAAVARAGLTTSASETSPAQFLASCFNIEEIHRLFQENHHLPTEIVRIILALALPEHFWTALYSIVAPIQNHHNLEFTIDIGVREARDGENKEDKEEEEEEEEPESDSDGDNDPDEKKSELSDDDISATPKDPKKKKND